MEKEYTQSDLFAKSNVPSNYVPVKLSSLGKLGLPALIHVRDYSFDDAISVSQMVESNAEVTVLNLLKSVIYENVNISKITMEDAVEIMLTIYGTWHNATITRTYYEDGKSKEALIKISSIKSIPFPNDISVPIVVSGKGKSVEFDYPRIQHIAIAKSYVNEKYLEEDNNMNELKIKVMSDKASINESEKYYQYEKKKNGEFLKVLNALQIISYNKEQSDNLETKLKWLDEIGIKMFNVAQKTISDKFKFGIDDNIEFQDADTGEMKTRRIPFRLIDLISIMGYEDDSEYSVSFGK